MSMDITDTILTVIYNNEFSPEQSHTLCDQILALYNKFELKNVQTKPINVVYMFYGALLSLSYTSKLQDNDIEALLVRKTGAGLKILISYKTARPDDLLIKALALDFKHRPERLTPFSSILANDLYQKLRSIRGETLTAEIFRQTFRNYQHLAVYQRQDGHMEIGITNVLLNLAENFYQKRRITRGFRRIMPNPGTFGTFEYNLVNMRKRSIGDAKWGAHQIISTIVDIYQTMAGPAQLSKMERNFYSFILGVFELNFAQKYKLEMAPIRDPVSKELIEVGLSIQTEHKQWVSRTYPIIFKLVHACDELWEQYRRNDDPTLSAMMDETAKPLFMMNTDAESAILLNINYDRVLRNILVFSKRVYRQNPVQSTMLTKELPIIIPHESFIQLLLAPMKSENYAVISRAYLKLISGALGSFYDKLLTKSQAYHNSFESYFLGLLLSGDNLQVGNELISASQFHYNEPLISKFVATVALTSHEKSTAIVFNMVQVNDNMNFNLLKNYLHTRSMNLPPNIRQVVRITIGSNEKNGEAFIDTVQQAIPMLPNVVTPYLEGELKSIDRLNADDLLISLVRSKESKYTLADENHNLHKVLENFKSFLNHRQISNNDVRAFLRGFFAKGFVIEYENVPNLFGILQADETPLFVAIASVEEGENYAKVAKTKLNSIMREYIRDYIINPMRRTADFVCIVHNIGYGNDAEYKGLMRMSTYGPTGTMIRGCTSAIGQRRPKRDIDNYCKELFEDDEEIINNIEDAEKFGENYINNDVESNRIEDKFSVMKSLIETKTAYVPTIKTYLPRLAKFSGALMTGVLFKNMIGALIRKDYKDFAINAAFLASGPLIESLSIRISSFGSKLVSSGSRFVGKTLLVTTPFLARLPMQGFIVYDLIQQVDRYKSGDKDAKVNIIGDSTILATEFVTAGIDGAAALGYLTTAAEFTGPVGMAVGTAIFIGVDIYSAVRTVAKIENLVHLTHWERFTSGVLSFLHVGSTSKVQNLMREKQIADTSAKNALNFFLEHPYVKNYIFPKYRLEGENLGFMNNNYANLNIKVEKWNRVWPVDMPRLKLTCSPYSFKVKNSDHNFKTSKILHECQDMFGYENLNNTLTMDITVILLEAGNDTVECAPSRNTIVIGDGLKNITGNTDIDTFILQSNFTYGIINGISGDDILNLNNYALNRGLKIQLNFDNGSVSNLKDEKEIVLKQLYNFIGRSSAFESVSCDCNTMFLDTRGGNDIQADEISIVDSSTCVFNMQIHIQGYMNVLNSAWNGTFNYLVKTENMSANIKFKDDSRATHILTILDNSIDHLELFEYSRNKNYTHEYDIKMHFKNNGKLSLMNSNENTTFHMGNNTEIRIMKDIMQIFTWSDLDDIHEIIREYYDMAHRLSAVVHVHAKSHNASILFGCGKASYHDKNSTEDINHINMIPSDPSKYSYLVGCKDNQNVYRISVNDLHNSVQNGITNMSIVEPMKPVKLFNTNFKTQNVPNVLDLYELVLLTKFYENSQLNYNFSVKNTDSEKNDILIQIFYMNNNQQDFSPLINITMKNVDFDHLIVINLRRPMKVSYTKDGQVNLAPTPINKYNSSYISINVLEIEARTEIISLKSLGVDYDTFIVQNYSLLITNSQFIGKEEDLVVVHLKDFFLEVEMQTLSLVFRDKIIRLEEQVDELNESEILEDVIDDVDFFNLTSTAVQQ